MFGYESLPQPVEVGINYYKLRSQDYAARHTALNDPALQSSGYYLAFGDKYCCRFRLRLRHWLSRAGQAWIDNTCKLLQQMIEQKRAEDPHAFARLEENAAALRSFAYSTHAAAYIQSGVGALPLRDLLLIVSSIDLKDLVNRDGLCQVLQVLAHLVNTYTQQALGGRRPVLVTRSGFIEKMMPGFG